MSIPKICVFEDVKPSVLNNLAIIEKVNYSLGDTIIKGDVGDLFYMIDYGSVAVHVQKGAKTQTVADLKPGQFFGELALLNNEPRAATVVATENTCLFYLSKEEFLSVLQNVPELGEEIRNSYMFAG